MLAKRLPLGNASTWPVARLLSVLSLAFACALGVDVGVAVCTFSQPGPVADAAGVAAFCSAILCKADEDVVCAVGVPPQPAKSIARATRHIYAEIDFFIIYLLL